MRKRQIYPWLRGVQLPRIFPRKKKPELGFQKQLGIDSELCNVFCIFSGKEEFLKTRMMTWNSLVCISHPALAGVAMPVWGWWGVREGHLLEILIKLFWQKPRRDSIAEFVPKNGVKLFSLPKTGHELNSPPAVQQVQPMSVLLE